MIPIINSKEPVLQIHPIPPLIPFPKEVVFGENQQHQQEQDPINICSSARVRRAFSRLNLGHSSFVCEIGNEDFSSVPNLQSNYQYVLRIDEQRISVTATEEWGALSALSTLAQLSVGFGKALPSCTIRDEPNFPWRGLLVDVARHFISLPTLFRCCDLMHHFKMNVLHLHLSDDQAFRFGSKVYPELVSTENYSLDELRQLIAYASDLGIRVVPELDVPGHTSSWLIKHPEWGFGEVKEVDLKEFGPHRGCLDPSNPQTMEAVLTLFEEIGNTFPDEYVHLGGDEVDPFYWEKSSRVQSWATANDLATVKDIQAQFTINVCERLFDLNKKAIVWDEALHELLPKSVTIQAWRGLRARDVSRAAGYQTIVSAPYYLDLHYPANLHYLYSPDMSSQDWRDADTVVRNDLRLAHVANGVSWHQEFGDYPNLPDMEPGSILGGEACMWSELVTDDLLLTRVWTRTPAIAERLWSDLDCEEVDSMYDRLSISLQRLPVLGLPNVLNIHQVHPCRALQPLFEMLEPVKWYGRLLSMERVRARAEGHDESAYARPYNQQTPLNRVVDRIPAESLLAAHLARSIEKGEDLSPWIIGWQNQHAVFDDCVDLYPELAELRPASEALAKIADVALGLAAYEPSLAGPFGEYILPIATVFADDF